MPSRKCVMFQLTTSLLTLVGALGGVALGSYLSSRSQSRTWERETSERSRRERQNTFAAFAAAAREWRAAIMSFDVVIHNAGAISRHPHAVGGQAQIECLRLRAQIALISASTETSTACDTVIAALGALSRARATYEAGTVPDSMINDCRDAERIFLAAARAELGITAL